LSRNNFIAYIIFALAAFAAFALIAATCPDVSAQVFAWDSSASLGATYLTKTTVDDSIKSWQGNEFPAPLPDVCDTTASSVDSTTVKVIANLDGAQGKKKMLFVYGNGSTAADTTVWVGTFKPQFLKTDSLYYWLAMADSANSAFEVEIWKPDGTVLYDSGRQAVGTALVRKSAPMTGFTLFDEYAIVYRFKVLNAADTITVGQAYIKRL